jgi:SulP family sulfate permease
MYFGAVEYLQKEFRKLDKLRPDQKHLGLLIDGSVGIDLAGAEWLVEESRNRKESGGGLYLVGRYPPLRRQLDQFHVTKLVGRQNIFRRKREMVAEMVTRLDPSICATCKTRVFFECKNQPGADAETTAESKTDEQTPKATTEEQTAEEKKPETST